ncbi:MAG: zinc ribbon domain-containing protein [Pseudobutyrivibrio sp.]|nr:zinc ribbon domain-containing protein [Pseudobutyrivibrio sp.]
MFCKKCGNQLIDGTRFCTNCGAPIEAPSNVVEQPATGNPMAEDIPTPAPTQNQTSFAPNQNQMYNQTPQKPKKKILPIIITILIILLLAVGGFTVYKLFFSAKTVNLDDYLTFTYEGYDTVGTLTMTIDDEAWETIYNDSKMSSSSSKSSEVEYAKRKLDGHVQYEIDKTEALTNDEELNLTWTIDTDYIKDEYGIIVKASDQKLKVEGLTEVESFSPFDDIKVVFNGLPGKGTCDIEIVNERDIYKKCDFTASQNSSLDEGDSITVTFDYNGYSYDAPDFTTYCAENFGMIPTETEKTYPVEGLGHYASTCVEINSDSLEEMKKDAEADLKLQEQYWAPSTSSVSRDYKGMYVQTFGERAEGNLVYLFYDVTVKIVDLDGNSEEITCTNHVVFEDVVVNPDGVAVYDDDSHVFCQDYFEYSSDILTSGPYEIFGYESIDDFDAKYVTPYAYITTDKNMTGGGSTL